jgi:dephospho-CoA kinase
VDKIILVTAPKDIRVQRVIYRDNVSEQKVKDRINAQLSDEEKLTYSDFVISNNDKEMVIPQVLDVYKSLLN